MLLERVGVGPLGEERGVSGLRGNDSGVKVGGSDGSKEESVWEGKDVVVVAGTGIMVWVAGQGISVIGSAGFMEEADVVVTERQNIAGETAVDLLGALVILAVLVVGENIDDELGSE